MSPLRVLAVILMKPLMGFLLKFRTASPEAEDSFKSNCGLFVNMTSTSPEAALNSLLSLISMPRASMSPLAVPTSNSPEALVTRILPDAVPNSISPSISSAVMRPLAVPISSVPENLVNSTSPEAVLKRMSPFRLRASMSPLAVLPRNSPFKFRSERLPDAVSASRTQVKSAASKSPEAVEKSRFVLSGTVSLQVERPRLLRPLNLSISSNRSPLCSSSGW